jgi:hypothetical protein
MLFINIRDTKNKLKFLINIDLDFIGINNNFTTPLKYLILLLTEFFLLINFLVFASFKF